MWLPHFAIQRWRRRRSEAVSADPMVLAIEGRHGPVIHAVNAAARTMGIAPGARVTDMRALVPDLRVEPAEQAADAADLVRLAGWARRWCPWTRAEGADALMLDTTGSDHLWGGEAAMLSAMSRSLGEMGLSVRPAAAPTLGAAWALARYAKAVPRGSVGPAADPTSDSAPAAALEGRAGTSVICPHDALAEHLAPLPVAALRLDADTRRLLDRLGLKSVGALADLDRTALSRRFRKGAAAQADPVLRLDQALGRVAEPVVPDLPAAPLRALRRMVEPIGDAISVQAVLAVLLEDIARQLETECLGARGLCLTGFRVDGGRAEARAAASRPSRDAAHWLRLFGERIEGMEAGYGFDVLALDVDGTEPLAVRQADLTGRVDRGVALARLSDRLAARLGPDAVQRPASHGSHMPERAETLSRPGPGGSEGRPAPLPPPAMPRPLRMLARPEAAHVVYAVPDGPPAQLVWRRKTHRVRRFEGPERIAPEWWREAPGARLRDYYRIEDEAGRRYWIFREGLPDDGRGETPVWYVHGIDG